MYVMNKKYINTFFTVVYNFKIKHFLCGEPTEPLSHFDLKILIMGDFDMYTCYLQSVC